MWVTLEQASSQHAKPSTDVVLQRTSPQQASR
jgi:hypothetical protein